VQPGQFGGGAQVLGADVAPQVACAQGSPRFQASEHGDDAPLICPRRQAELGEDVVDVLLDRAGGGDRGVGPPSAMSASTSRSRE